ncbi:hypothetical protein [Bartonella sp. CL100XZDX]|uniref:hypothetical protein n=1 Tax=Bartonella sp. CL100XZDX TaxID=3243515 RepID=UPI0035CF2CDB
MVRAGGAAMKGPQCFFIAVTMVRVMLLFFGKESFEGRFFSRYGKRGHEEPMHEELWGTCWGQPVV